MVDEQGAVIPDSTRFAIAIPDRAYEGQLRQAFSEYRFSPAVYQGCAVTAGMIVVLTNVDHP
ncbi:MAG TPA: hypothetical protein VFI13_10260 [Gemmatimonadales bacterium]|nr:hypothetical protein [Gemmatimonadales bacterium]